LSADARAVLERFAPRIEAALEAALPDPTTTPAPLLGAMRHLLFPGGKRLRPALALAAAEAVGGDPDAALPAAVAVELVHTYSLVHDDLPCMDDDDERRGRPTVHRAYDEATAVLAGDALLTAAFEALTAGAQADSVPRRFGTVAALARAAGARGLVGGQADDLAPGAEPTAAGVESVHARKTAALIAASVSGGARLAGADEAALSKLHAAGIAAGIAFQIVDDLLDTDEDDVCSLLRVMGPDAARARARKHLADALDGLADLGADADPLRALLRFAVERER
jgi:geranylgeranyl pyrophosphate synthase